MKTVELVLERLRDSFERASHIAGLSKPPLQHLVVVDRYGEDISGVSSVPILSNYEAHEFSVGLAKWLDQQSARLIDSNIGDAMSSMEADAKHVFDGKIKLFGNLVDAATWYADPKYDECDSFVPYLITSGLPIYGLSIAKDEA